MRFAVLDTETTGLPDDPDSRVVEVGVAVFDTDDPDGVVLRTFVSLVRPDVLTDAGRECLETINHIPVDEVLAAPPPDQVWGELVAFLDGLPVRAYNEEFDRDMMERTFPEAGSGLAWGPPCGDNVALWRRFPSCIMEAFLERFAVYSRMKDDLSGPYPFRLRAAREILGIEAPGGSDHRALTDAIVAGFVAWALERGAIPSEAVIVDRIRTYVDRSAPVFHATPATVLPTFFPIGSTGGAVASQAIRPSPGLERLRIDELPRISLRRKDS